MGTRVRERKNQRKRKAKRPWAKRSVIVVLVLVAAATISWFSYQHNLSPTVALLTAASDEATPSYFLADLRHSAVADRSAARPLFPYSVIPRGAANSGELRTALERDSVAAAHYSDFNTRSSYTVRLAEDRLAYVSYRLGNHIYWTKKKVKLHAGETLLSDGTHFARTRCGNRVSDVPVDPTSSVEPPEHVLNSPVNLPHPDVSPEPYPFAPIWSESAQPVFALSVPNTPLGGVPPSGGGGAFPIPLSPVCCAGGGFSIPPIYSQPPPGPPPVTTPEPRTIVLLARGLIAIFLLMKFRQG
jgi:hypothetical protein